MNQKLVDRVSSKRNINSTYKHVKSRYLEKSRIEKQLQDTPKHSYLTKIKKVDSNATLEDTERDSEKIKIERVQCIPLPDKCNIELLDYEYYDEYSGFINVIFTIDDIRQAKYKKYKYGPSIRTEPVLLSTLHDLLKLSKTPIDMLHVAFIVSRYKTNDINTLSNQWFDIPEYNWLWVVEVIMIAARAMDSHLHDGDDDRLESAVFWYAGGVFYSRNGYTEIAMEYFKKARKISNNPSKLIFPFVPSDLHKEMEIKQYERFVKEPYSVWTLTCLHQSDILKNTTVHQEPKKALRTLYHALNLLKVSNEPDNTPRVLIAKVYYELGLKYKALGLTKRSINAFRKCIDFAENEHHELDLMAKFMVTRTSRCPPKNWSYLELKKEAIKRLNLRMLVKTSVALGMVAQKKDRFEEGFHHFGVAEWLSRKSNRNIDSLDIEIAIMNMAICRTKRFFQLFPKPKRYESRYKMKGCNQWTYLEEKNMYCRVEAEARELFDLFGFYFDDSDDDYDMFLENGEEFLKEEEFLEDDDE